MDAKELKPGHCHKCGLALTENPHPEAGKPDHVLNVGCPKECIPCLTLSRHSWYTRAMKSESELRDLRAALPSDAAQAPSAWQNGTPPVPEGQCHEFIIAVRRVAVDKTLVYSANYANKFTDDGILSDRNGEEYVANGWYHIGLDMSGEFNEVYEAIDLSDGDAVVGWQELPKWSAAAPVVPAAAAPINLEGLRKKLLTPRKFLRDENGWLSHPDYPICDEGTRADQFLEAFGIETWFRLMESDVPDFAERYHEEGLTNCSEWTPTPPAGEGWLLLEIYDTEDGPCALFGRDQYEAENAQKRQRMRELSERIKQRQADKGASQ